MPHRKLNITDWQQPARIVVPARREKRWFADVRLAGLVGTLAVHALVFQPLLLGTRAHTVRPPETQGVSATSRKSDVAPSETLILIDLPVASTSPTALAEELASLGPKPDESLITVLSPDPLPHIEIAPNPLSEEDDSPAAIDSGDLAARAAMFGRYSGQIDARIERAWRRPRSPITLASDSDRPVHHASTDEMFKCQVRIIQDAHGVVQEVQLLSCNGNTAWQHSLVAAILAASPLPAPPTSAVFTTAITMTFTASPYTQASAADDYEIEPSTALRVADSQ